MSEVLKIIHTSQRKVKLSHTKAGYALCFSDCEIGRLTPASSLFSSCDVFTCLYPCLLPHRGAVVKARDKYRHPECFVCADCNLNLKQKGYFFVEGELYCETHARARTRPPEGYDTVTLYPKA